MGRLLKFVSAMGEAYRGLKLVGAGMVSWYRSMLPGTEVDFESKAGRVYDNSVVSGGVGWAWRQSVYPRFIVRKEGEEKLGKVQFTEVRRHPLPKAFSSGIYQDRTGLLYGIILSWFSRGNCYLEKVRSAAGQVVGFAYLPHHLVEVRNDFDNADGTKLITHYRYYIPLAGHRDILPSEIVHLRYGVDPMNPALGLSPLYASLREVVGENIASTLTAALLENGGILGVSFSPKDSAKLEVPKDPEKKEEFLSRIRQAVKADRAGEPILFPFAVDVNTIGHSPDKLVINITRAINVSRICASMGIDPMVLGLPSETKTYSNFEEALDAAMYGAILPMLMVIAEQFDRQCLWTDFGADETLSCGWDTSSVPALQEEEKEKVDCAVAAFHGDLVTRNEAREKLGYGPVTGGDVFFSDQVAKMTEDKKKMYMGIADRAKKRRSESQHEKDLIEQIGREIVDGRSSA